MRYELMFPKQIRRAIKESWPLAIPVGVLEYHAEHCVVGVDTLLPVRALEALEKEMELVIFPPYYLGAATYAAAPPEKNGTIHISSGAIHRLMSELFTGLLRVGFRNIHAFIHHQSENFTAGMPTDLAIKLAAREAIFALLEREKGEGWWGDEKMASYYSEHEKGTDPFNWIQVHPFMDAAAQKKFPIDHAGEQETSLMMAFCPEGVNMAGFSAGKHWFARGAKKANPGYGKAAAKMILTSLRKTLRGAA